MIKITQNNVHTHEKTNIIKKKKPKAPPKKQRKNMKFLCALKAVVLACALQFCDRIQFRV